MYRKIQDRRQIEHTDRKKTKHNPEKPNNEIHTKKNYPGSDVSYDTWPGTGAYSTALPSPHGDLRVNHDGGC